MAFKIKNEVEIIWWERELISRKGSIYMADAYYKGTSIVAWHSTGYDLEETLLSLRQSIERDGLTVLSVSKGNTNEKH